MEFNGNIATVTLCKSGAFYYNFYWPGNVQNLTAWNSVTYIKFVSENGAEYNSDDWLYIQNLFNKFGDGSLSLDCSEMIIDDSRFKFATRKVSYIKMPNTLVNLATEAFDNCTYLSAIGWSPALETIGEEAFYGTAFTSITVPEGVTYIGDGAFSFCHNLTTVTLPTTLQRVGEDMLEGSPVTAIHSHNKTAPVCEGEISDNTGWDLANHEFAFYEDCILYLQPDAATIESYLNSPIWCKFFLAGSAKICLHTYDTNRPLVEGVQLLTVDQTNVSSEVTLDGFTRTFHINTVYQREMTNAKWYTIMLPFPVDATTVASVFGSGTQIMGYSGIHANTLCFEEVQTSISADTPYLIKPGTSKGEYEFEGEDTYYSTPLASTEISVSGTNSSYNQYASEFVGTYNNKQIPVYAYYLKNNKFYYMPSTNTSKGWKAYGAVVMINAGSNASAARPSATYLEASFDAGNATGIDAPTIETIEIQSLEGPIYTLSGQRVNNPGKGIYISNGKKVLIK